MPEPRSVGDMKRGRDISQGVFRASGFEGVIGDGSLWDMHNSPDHVLRALHAFSWLDDIAAWGDDRARARARMWLAEWLSNFGAGQFPAWEPDLAGARIFRLINHAEFLGLLDEGENNSAIMRSLHVQLMFVARHWRRATLGMPRATALAGLICAALATSGHDVKAVPLMARLDAELDQFLADDFEVYSRNPEELLAVLTLLAWVFRACQDADLEPPAGLTAKAEGIGPVLRALRHGSGALARFHGSSRGAEGQLDGALAYAGARAETPLEETMGFARLTSGATTIVMDVAAPAKGKNSPLAHASINAIEMNSGHRPILVSCGSAALFGEKSALGSRTTAAHSTLDINGTSSVGFSAPKNAGTFISKVPSEVRYKRTKAIDGVRLQCGHDGFLKQFGVMHARTLDLTTSGRGLVGEDVLAAQSKSEIATFEKACAGDQGGILANVRFHLHPNVTPELDPVAGSVSLTLSNGDIWTFTHDGAATLALEPGSYFQQNLEHPLQTYQIVLSLLATTPISRVRWSLVKTDAKA